jgi:hypothetical protein
VRAQAHIVENGELVEPGMVDEASRTNMCWGRTEKWLFNAVLWKGKITSKEKRKHKEHMSEETRVGNGSQERQEIEVMVVLLAAQRVGGDSWGPRGAKTSNAKWARIWKRKEK